MSRRPTPTSILRLRGSWRANTRPDEPKPRVAAPSPPTWLSPAAKTEFTRLARELADIGMITALDRGVLAAFCVLRERWIEAECRVGELGVVVKSPNGFPVINPYLSVANEALRQLRAYAIELGLTPSSRSK